MLVDAELLKRVSDGDREAAGSLVEGLWPDAYRIARMVTKNSQTAEDATQSACIEMLNSLPRLRNPASFRSWFFRLVTRAAYRENRRSGWQELVRPLPEQAEATPEQGDLRAAIWSLNPRERLVLTLHYHYGYRSHETLRC
ncbi:MAG: RNA polymerase sigma factor [Thermaerobacter sp.]|nr:RNA polymerase sigma factor [Thermaerobacter sp.]